MKQTEFAKSAAGAVKLLTAPNCYLGDEPNPYPGEFGDTGGSSGSHTKLVII